MSDLLGNCLDNAKSEGKISLSVTDQQINSVYHNEIKKSEIMTTSLSFGGTIAGAMKLGCTFGFTDIDKSLGIDPDAVIDLLSIRPKTKAIIAVDYAGIPHPAGSNFLPFQKFLFQIENFQQLIYIQLFYHHFVG